MNVRVIACLLVFNVVFIGHSHALVNEPVEIIFVSDELAQTEKLTGASLVIEHLKRELAEQLKFVYIGASRKREWLELTSHDNVCLYNKIKTVEREQSAIFSELPIQIFPPNQLITIDVPHLPDELTIEEAIEKYQLKIAIQAGRSYGKDTDKQLQDNLTKLIVVEGLNSTNRIMDMLLSGRINAIVEFPTVVDNSLKANDKTGLIERINAFQIESGAGFAHGYIACSKTPQGQNLINILNAALGRESVQQMMIKQNVFYFPAISHMSITNEWQKLIAQAKH
ncbi:hypothetical protein [Thalassotalea marina]|uniref:Uncharacterized protein n=1 Tax=Thalassotalea marina TaxID=1673741 RepID=A0A919BFR5_9GAMM|nr:hypothetical protein [Thalassotalea marina]GHF85937.1 hypothetical protein GCM10017161_11960 [Thalassotalea marina]